MTRFGSMIINARNPACPRSACILALIVFLASLGSFIWTAASRGILSAPPVNGGDEDSYERLGFNLASGLGFGYCPEDLPILEGRAEPRSVARCEAGCHPEEFRLTAYRPPGFPVLIAAVYRFSPLDFRAIRIVNCVFCSLAIALAVFVFAARKSVLAGCGAGLLCTVDPRFREFAGTFLTENMATLTFVMFAIALTRLLERPSSRSATACGLSLSLLVVTRSFYVAWYPAVWLLVSGVLAREAMTQADSLRAACRMFLLFAVGSLLLTGPWWIRNCLVLNAIMPTGTQGGIGIADGFSDSAWENHGSWASTTADQILNDIKQDPVLAGLSAIELEKEHCRRGAAHARAWMQANFSRLATLTWWKLSRLWEIDSRLHSVLFSVMFLGMFLTRQQMLARVMLILLILNSLTVMATYHTYERFFTPFRPLAHGFVAVGVEWLLLATVEKIRSTDKPVRH